MEGKKFFNIIEDTLKIFGEMENFYYNYFQNSENSCEFWVSMVVKN